MSNEPLHHAIRDVIDFPTPGIIFKDITPILADGALFKLAIDRLCETFQNHPIDKVVGIDARGFIFAAAVADRLGCGLVLVRKKGKLPWKTRQVAYSLEYGESIVEIHEDSISPGDNLVLVDDLLATGGTAAAAAQLVTELGGNLLAISVLIELANLHGRDKILSFPVHSVLSY